MHYEKDFGVEVRVARFHNIYGCEGTWKGGREKVNYPPTITRRERRME